MKRQLLWWLLSLVTVTSPLIAVAEIRRVGLDGCAASDIKRVSITEVGVPDRTSTLTLPRQILPFCGQFSNWLLSHSRRFPKKHFEQVFAIRYSILIERPDSSYTLVLAEEQPLDESSVSFLQLGLWQPQPDGSYKEYLVGTRRALAAEPTEVESFLANLFEQATKPNKPVQINAVDAPRRSGAVIAISRSPRNV